MTEATHVNSSVALITNVAVCNQALTAVMEREPHLPSMAVFYGPAGYGKSMAASFVANTHRAYYVECKSSWTRKALLLAILKEMGIQPAKAIYEMTEQVSEQLVLSSRPLIIDEVDHIVKKKAVEIIRDIYEGSHAPILLIGEEQLPHNLLKWERFHSRIMEFAPAQAVSLDDTKKLMSLYCEGIKIADGLLNKVLELSHGSVRRVCVNLTRIKAEAKRQGLQLIDLEAWGDKELYTGMAPCRNRRVKG